MSSAKPATSDERVRSISQTPLSGESIIEKLNEFTDKQIEEYGNKLPKLQPDEAVVGEVPVAARKFFILANNYRELANALQVKIGLEFEASFFMPFSDEQEHEAFHRDQNLHKELEEKYRLFIHMGWLAIKDVYGRVSREERLTITQGWKLAKLPDPRIGIVVVLEKIVRDDFGFELN